MELLLGQVPRHPRRAAAFAEGAQPVEHLERERPPEIRDQSLPGMPDGLPERQVVEGQALGIAGSRIAPGAFQDVRQDAPVDHRCVDAVGERHPVAGELVAAQVGQAGHGRDHRRPRDAHDHDRDIAGHAGRDEDPLAGRERRRLVAGAGEARTREEQGDGLGPAKGHAGVEPVRRPTVSVLRVVDARIAPGREVHLEGHVGNDGVVVPLQPLGRAQLRSGRPCRTDACVVPPIGATMEPAQRRMPSSTNGVSSMWLNKSGFPSARTARGGTWVM